MGSGRTLARIPPPPSSRCPPVSQRKSCMAEPVRVIPLERLRMRDLAQVGGKNASLGEMIGELASAGIRVPGGFATTAEASREFLQQDKLGARIEESIRHLDVGDVRALAAAGATIRGWI